MAITNEYTIKISVKDAQANVDELNKSLKSQTQLIQELEDSVSDYERELENLNKKDANRIKQTKELIETTKKQLKEEKSGLQAVNRDRKQSNIDLKEAKKNQADYGGVLGFVDKQTGGAISGMQKFTKTITGATKGFKLMKIAWMATGLGALVVLITSIVGAFTRTEEGQEKFARGMAMVGAVVDQALDLFANLGTAIIDVFMNPVESLKNFGNSIQEFVMDKVQLVIDGMGLMGSAISKLFSGDFSGALDDAGEGFINLNRGLNVAVMVTEEVIKGTNKLIKATGSLINETLKEVDVMNKVTKMRQKAHHIERELQVERAKANREISDIRLKAEDRENQSAEDRIILLRKAQAIEEDITKKEIKAKQMMVNALILEQSISLSTMEDKDKLAKIQAELIQLDTKKLASQRLLQTQITTALNEEMAAAKELQNFKDSLRILDEENKFAQIEQEKADRLKQLEDLKASETEKQQIKLDIEQSFKDKKKIIEEEEKVLLNEEREKFLESELGKEELKLEEQRNKALDELMRFEHTAEQKAAINDKYNKLQEQQDKAVSAAKLGIAKQGMALLGEIAGKGSAVGKAMAIGQATISGIEGVQNAYTTAQKSPITAAFPAYPYIQAGLAGAFSALQIKKIASTKANGKGSSPAPSSSAGGAPSTPALPPSFNVVGASETNQLADAIGGQSQQPIQTYVVASDVSTAQELDRNIVTGATIG